MTTTNTGTSASTAISIYTPELTNNGGQITTTSLQVAQHFGKRHADVLRAIGKLDCSQEFTERNFALSEFIDSTGRKLPMFHITKDGFVFLAMGFTGKEAAQWKEAYIAAFNRMQDELNRIALPSATISPAQAQHLRELVQLVIESGRQGHGETWARLHRKMKVNSYLALHPSRFDAACQYLRGKFDDTSIAALIHKHLPSAVPALPAPAAQAMDVHTLCQLILGGIFTGQDFLRLAYAVNQHQFRQAASNPNRGYGEEVASKVREMSWSDLHIINQRVSMEVWVRTESPAKEIAA